MNERGAQLWPIANVIVQIFFLMIVCEAEVTFFLLPYIYFLFNKRTNKQTPDRSSLSVHRNTYIYASQNSYTMLVGN